MMGPEGALRLLLRRFPEFAQLFGDPNNPEPEEPHYSYGVFAEAALKRLSDGAFLERTASFINELTASNESILKDVVGVDVLETLAQVPEAAQALYPKLVQSAQEDLKAIERGFYGRTVE